MFRGRKSSSSAARHCLQLTVSAMNLSGIMRGSVPYVVLCLFFSWHKPALAADSAVSDQDVERLSQARTTAELSESCRSLFARATDSDVRRLVVHPKRCVGLLAGWERVRRTVPAQNRNVPSAPSQEALHRFLGVVEGRVCVPVPTFWESVLLSADSQGRDNIYFSWPEQFNSATSANADERGNISSAPASGERSDKKAVVKDEAHSSLLRDVASRIEKSCALSSKDTVFRCRYLPCPGSYPIVAEDRRGGHVKWTADVWAAGASTVYTGRHWHHVDLAVRGNELVVFGASGTALYIEVFDAVTGKNICRFSTEYLEVSPG
jgi:hypothetical protein